MYRHCEQVPWHQDEQDDWIDVRLTVEILRDLGPFDEVHDLGCGLGDYLALMCGHVGVRSCRGFSYDISETACSRASVAFPQFSFRVLDMTGVPTNQCRNPRTKSHRLFIIRGTLWHVFPRIMQVV